MSSSSSSSKSIDYFSSEDESHTDLACRNVDWAPNVDARLKNHIQRAHGWHKQSLETSKTSVLLKWTPDVVSVTTCSCVRSLRYLVITFSTWTRFHYNNHGVVTYSSTSFIQISVCCETVLLFLSTAIIGKLCFEIRMAWRDYRHIFMRHFLQTERQYLQYAPEQKPICSVTKYVWKNTRQDKELSAMCYLTVD